MQYNFRCTDGDGDGVEGVEDDEVAGQVGGWGMAREECR